MSSLSGPNLFTERMKFPLLAIKNSKFDLFYITSSQSAVNLKSFNPESDVTLFNNDEMRMVRIATIANYLDDMTGRDPNP